MKVISFSRYFPAQHPKKGQETLFIQKILLSLWECGLISMSKMAELGREFNLPGIQSINEIRQFDQKPKHHTIRAGHRWKEGEWFSPRFWTGSPYNRLRDGSRPVEFVPGGIQITKVWPFEVDENGVASLNGRYLFDYDYSKEQLSEPNKIENLIAQNDGLTYEDWSNWIIQPCFRKEKAFDGQIICWNPEISY